MSVQESSHCLPTWRDTCWSTPVWGPSSAMCASRLLSRSRLSKRTWLSTCQLSLSNARWVNLYVRTRWIPQWKKWRGRTDYGAIVSQVCGKSFNRMYNLLGHMHLHAGSKPFKCPYCTSKFNLKGNLSRHMKVKHGIMDTSIDGQGKQIPQLSSNTLDFETDATPCWHLLMSRVWQISQ